MNFQRVKDIIKSDVYTLLHEIGFVVEDSSKGLGFIRPTDQGKEFISPGSIKTKDALLDAIENRFNDIFKVK